MMRVAEIYVVMRVAKIYSVMRVAEMCVTSSSIFPGPALTCRGGHNREHHRMADAFITPPHC